MLTGEIDCRQINPNFGLKRFIEQNLGDWMHTNAHDIRSFELKYDISFERSDAHRSAAVCQLRIIGQEQMWFSSQVGRNARDAFVRTLATLKKIYEHVEYSHHGNMRAVGLRH